MNGCNECQQLSRRGFLKSTGAGLGALAMADPVLDMVASTYAQSSGGTGNLLVLCQLNGGLDALSFLAPYRNAAYRAARPVLALGEDQVTPLTDNNEYGINNLFPFFSELYRQGQLAVVQQVAYPEGNGSHFESQEIYEFGVRNLANAGAGNTWYQRLKSTYFNQPFSVLDTQTVGDPQRYGYPDQSYRQAAQDAFGRLARLKTDRKPMQQAVLNAYQTIDELGEEIRTKTEDFESTGDARGEFFRAAMLASAGLGTRILRLSYGGFDTHGSQDEANQELFPRINDHFQQFVTDLDSRGLWENTCVCFYSEFGRRNYENGSPGTDHGHGGHMILAGPRVNGGLHGQEVTSNDMMQDSLPYYVDFRAVFSSCIRDWLGFDPQPIFQIGGETYDETVGSELFV